MLHKTKAHSALYLAILTASTGLTVSYAPAAISAALEEVVVTARKREESVQEVPIAVSAFSGDQLREAGVSDIQGLANQVPGLQMDSGGIAQMWIRGVGQRSNYSYIDSPTGVYLDGLFISRKEGQMLDLMDMESVQVLRGPQGTLFGKNTTAGALVMNTRKPDTQFGGEIEARVGNYGRQDARLVVNAPLIEDKLLSKVTMAQVKRDGYMENLLNGDEAGDEDRLAGSLQLRWLASESVTVDAFFYGAKTREVPPALQGSSLHGSGPYGSDSFYQNLMWPGDSIPVWAMETIIPGPTPAGYVPNSPTYIGDHDAARAATRGNYKYLSNSRGTNDVDNYMSGITVEWEVNPNLSVKSITGYGKQRVGPGFGFRDGDGTAGVYQQYAPTSASPREQYSQEFQFTGDALDGRLQYTTGLFGMLEKIEDNNSFTGMINGVAIPMSLLSILDPSVGQLPNDLLGVAILPPSASYNDTYKLQNTTLAAFFQTSYDITDHLQATVGLRWTSEKRDSKFTHQAVDGDEFANIVANAGLGAAAFAFPGTTMMLPFFLAGLPPLDDPLNPSMGTTLAQVQALFPRDANGNFMYPMADIQRLKANKTWEELSPMASLSYTLPGEWLNSTPIDSMMTYFTYSEGFKSGTFVQFGNTLRTVEPETIKNFEVGLKMDAFDRSVRLNLAAYKMKYDNQQLIQVLTNPDGAFPVVTYANASKSEITGVEAEFNWQVTPGLLVSAGGSYNDYDFQDFGDRMFLLGALLAPGTELPFIDRSGERFPEVPTWTANLAVQYTFDIGVGTLTPRLQYNYVSDVYMGLDGGAWRVKDQAEVPGYGTLSARLAYRSPDDRWQAVLYGENITDKLYYQGTVATGDTLGEFNRMPSPPRMYGLELSYKFGAR